MRRLRRWAVCLQPLPASAPLQGGGDAAGRQVTGISAQLARLAAAARRRAVYAFGPRSVKSRFFWKRFDNSALPDSRNTAFLLCGFLYSAGGRRDSHVRAHTRRDVDERVFERLRNPVAGAQPYRQAFHATAGSSLRGRFAGARPVVFGQ